MTLYWTCAMLAAGAMHAMSRIIRKILVNVVRIIFATSFIAVERCGKKFRKIQRQSELGRRSRGWKDCLSLRGHARCFRTWKHVETCRSENS
jgi:hypothetical protein